MRALLDSVIDLIFLWNSITTHFQHAAFGIPAVGPSSFLDSPSIPRPGLQGGVGAFLPRTQGIKLRKNGIIEEKMAPGDCLFCIYLITSRINKIQELKEPWQLNAERAVLVNK